MNSKSAIGLSRDALGRLASVDLNFEGAVGPPASFSVS